MSVIAAKVTNEYIDIASDSIICKDTLKRTNFHKLRHINTDLIVGGCGVAEELSLFFEYAKKYTPCGDTISDIQDYMLNFSHIKEQYMREPKLECAYLIVFKGHLFEVDGMLVQEIFDYTAIGEGEDYALAALHLNHSVQEAVKVACDLCCYVAEPIIEYKVTGGVIYAISL